MRLARDLSKEILVLTPQKVPLLVDSSRVLVLTLESNELEDARTSPTYDVRASLDISLSRQQTSGMEQIAILQSI